ncbi:MAG: serine/threonine protein kinase [bacterium]|nr:MAG: serine/threonine protein kinase [bacterium]
MSEKKKKHNRRIWRLSSDVVIRPVTEMPEEAIEQITQNKRNPENYFGIERKKSRAQAKIVNKDVIDVLRAFGDEGKTYDEVLEYFLELKGLERDELHPAMSKMVNTFIGSNFLVEGRRYDKDTSESVEPSFQDGDRWLSYRILKNVHVIIDTEIYQVEHIPSGVTRALKITQPTFPREKMKKKIFKRLEHEFKTIQKIKHPNIIKVHDYGMHEGRMYGILDWVDGRSVYSHAYDSGTPPHDGLLLELSIECLEALGAVHRARYLHGDVHTRNFLIKNGHVCLIDFGLSRPIKVRKAEERRYVEGGVIRFMPPEYVQYKLEEKKGLWGSIAGEIYSVGVMIFSLFTSTYPYKWSFYRKDFMEHILNDPPPSFEECERDPWPELEAVLHKALEKDPKDRFASVDEFSRALQKLSVP